MTIYVLCPSGSKTGGAECLHQFVHALRANGADAYISYTPDPAGSGSHEFFRNYDSPIKDPIDHPESVVVVPELSTYLAKDYPKSKKAVFWLSVDNYFYRKRNSLLADWYRRIRSLQTTRLRLGAMREFYHISQSHYASEFLVKKGLRAIYVGDHLNDDFVATVRDRQVRNVEKRDQVAFNPKKGAHYIRRLAESNPDIRFVPIVNMTREQVVDLLSESKLYIDLGPHPGKDRIPREAASLGCCVITNRMGSAGNDVDLPIPEDCKYGLNRRELDRIPTKIKEIFRNFPEEHRRFEIYRTVIRNEKEKFFLDTKNCIEALKG